MANEKPLDKGYRQNTGGAIAIPQRVRVCAAKPMRVSRRFWQLGQCFRHQIC